MAGSTPINRTYGITQLGISFQNASIPGWTMLYSGGIASLHKEATGNTGSVVNLQVPHSPRGGSNEDAQVSVLSVFYLVTTADLTSAPTAALNKVTYPAGTALVASATVTQSLTFGGIDSIGKVNGAGAAGSHTAIVTITTPITLATTDNLYLALTMGEAATSVLDIFGMQVTYR